MPRKCLLFSRADNPIETYTAPLPSVVQFSEPFSRNLLKLRGNGFAGAHKIGPTNCMHVHMRWLMSAVL